MAVNTDLTVTLKAINQTTAAFNGVNNNLNGLKKIALEVGAALTSALAIRNIVSTTDEWALSVKRLQDVTGLTAQQASRLSFAGKQAGVDADELALSMDRLAKQMFSNSTLADKGKDAFSKWGIQLRDTNGAVKNINDVFLEASAKVQKLGNGAAAAALEQDLFSKSGGRLHDMLMLGADGLKQFMKEADSLGLTLDQLSMEQTIQQSRQLDAAFLGIRVQIGKFLLPFLLAITDGLVRFVQWVRSATVNSQFFSGVIKFLGNAFQVVLGIIKQVGDRLNIFAKEIDAKGFAAAFQNLVADIISKAKELLPKIGEELDKLGPIGWIIKLALLSAAISVALGFAEGVLGGVIGIFRGLAGPLTWGLGTGNLALVGSMYAGIALGLSLYSFMSDDLKNGVQAFVTTNGFWAGVFGVGAAGVAVSLAASPAIVISLIALAAITIGAQVMAGDTSGVQKLLSSPGFWAGMLGIQAAILAISLGASPEIVITLAGLGIITWSLQSIFGTAPAGSGVSQAACEAAGGTWDPRRQVCIGAHTVSSGGGGGGAVRGPDASKIPEQPTCDAGYHPFYDGTTNTWSCVANGGGGSGRGNYDKGGIVPGPIGSPVIATVHGGEAIIPLDRGGGMGNTINVYVSGNIATSERELAERIADQVGSVLVRSTLSQRNLAY